MKVQFSQSGGIVGIIKSCELDTELMSPEDATTLINLIEGAGKLQSSVALSEQGRDMREYEITIDAEQPISIVFDDANIPANYRALLGFLIKHARAGF